jgi:hypothetical protein
MSVPLSIVRQQTRRAAIGGHHIRPCEYKSSVAIAWYICQGKYMAHETLPRAVLAYLRRHGLVVGRKEGLWVHYRLADDLLPAVQRAVDAVLHCVRHAQQAQDDGRQLARATGRRIALHPAPTAGCCAPREPGAR